MEIGRIERRLKKINSVLDIFKEDNKISKLEKDLLLGYVRELYDLILDDSTSTSTIAAVKTIEKINEIEVKQEELPKVIENNKELLVEKIEIIEPLSSIIESNEEIKPIEIVPIEVAPKIEDIKEVVNQHEVDEPKVNNKIPKELENMFNFEDYLDVSEKLGLTKIESIANSIGINDRFYMINELFGEDSELFNNIISKLETIGDFEKAKDIVIHEVAIPKLWLEEEKIEGAEDFLKLVWRKYKA